MESSSESEKDHVEEESTENDLHEEDDEELWWLMMAATATISSYFGTYIYKEPCMTSYQTGMNWLAEILSGRDLRSINMFRMDKDTILKLVGELQSSSNLQSSRRMSVIEKVCMFLYTIALGASNRHVCERFQRSTETISRVFNEVLDAVWSLSEHIIRPGDFNTIPQEILNDTRYMPYFKDCIGAIDGTHVHACVNAENQIRYIGRKGIPTQNVMAACSFDMQFIYACAGWEGTAHDTRIFNSVVNNPEWKFPQPPAGKYYVVDAGYPDVNGYLKPYKRTRYHLPDFQRGQPPRGRKEIFNRAHSSLRCCIERTFGVWKRRWKILRDMSSYPFPTQAKIVITTMVLHNFIRRETLEDPAFKRLDENPDFIPEDIFPDAEGISQDSMHMGEGSMQSEWNSSQILPMNVVRNSIANSMMLNR